MSSIVRISQGEHGPLGGVRGGGGARVVARDAAAHRGRIDQRAAALVECTSSIDFKPLIIEPYLILCACRGGLTQ